MAGPLILTKLYVPRVRPGLVARPLLLERLGLAGTAKLTLVSAPPGFGKTTLLAAWARAALDASGHVAWYSLDASDNDPASFWAYVVAALGRAAPVSATGVALPGGNRPAEEVVTALVNALAAIEAETWLVLDDFHVIDNPQIRQGVELLIEHLPPQAHVVVNSRSDPDFPLSRWRVRGELLEIRAADLRFSAAEAAEYLRAASGVELGDAAIAKLAARTEGWIAALQLASLSLRGREDADGFVSRFAGDDRYVVDYLMDEVLAHQTPEVREFLLLTAPLQRLTGDLCDAVTGRADGSATLAALEAANLFVVPLDEGGRWFRYHHLFADVLRARLLAERPEELGRVHRRASAWLEANGLAEDAIRHALEGGDAERAGRLIELALPEARRGRRDTVLMGWLRALPEEVVRANPVLTVFDGWTYLTVGDLAALESRLDHADELLAAGPSTGAQPWAETPELRTLPATIAVYRAAIAQARGDIDGVARHASAALELIEPDDHMARGSAAGFLALAAWTEGDIRLALDTFTSALASIHAAGHVVDELSSTALLAQMWTVAGRPDRARELCRRALAAAEPWGAAAARAAADLHVALAELDVAAGDLDAAQRHLDTAEPLEQQVPNSEGLHRWFVAAAALAVARADLDRAQRLLEEAESAYRPGFFPDLRPLPAMRARVWIAAGDLGRAAGWAADSGVAVTDEARYRSEYEHLTLVRLLLADPGSAAARDGATALLHRLEAAAEQAGRVASLVEIRQLLAIVEGRVAGAAGGAETDPSPSAGPLSARELQVLRLLDSELTGPEIARHLFVSHNTLRTHTKHIFAKLDVRTRRAAVASARERGLL